MPSILPFTFQKRLFFNLLLAFIVTTVILYLLYLSTTWVGRSIRENNPKMCYWGVLITKVNPTYHRYLEIEERNKFAIDHNRPFADQALFEEIRRNIIDEEFIIGILECLPDALLGTIGFILMWRYGKITALRPRQWLLILLSLFWMKFLLLSILLIFFLGTNAWLFDRHSNPYSNVFLPPWFYIVTGLIAIIVFLIVLFRFIPVRQRFTFILAGLAGVPVAAALWAFVIGPVVLPVPSY